MPPRDWRLRIEDILEAIHKTQRYVSGLSFDEFCADDKVVDAVVRNLEVIGEAARHIPPEIESRHPGVPWGEMRGMRNIGASRVQVLVGLYRRRREGYRIRQCGREGGSQAYQGKGIGVYI